MNFHVGVVQNENARTHTGATRAISAAKERLERERSHIEVLAHPQRENVACKQMGGSDVLGAVNTANRAINMQISVIGLVGLRHFERELIRLNRFNSK